MDITDFDLTDPGLLNFLKTTRSKEDLKTALSVLEEFKQAESSAEYFGGSFSLWVRLEQFEDYLRLLTGEGVNQVDDKIAKSYFEALKKKEETQGGTTDEPV